MGNFGIAVAWYEILVLFVWHGIFSDDILLKLMHVSDLAILINVFAEFDMGSAAPINGLCLFWGVCSSVLECHILLLLKTGNHFRYLMSI